MKASAGYVKEALLGLSPIESSEDEEESQALRTVWPSLALHRAAFDGDIQELLQILSSSPAESKQATDAHGNSALHVAVLRHHPAAVEVLLAAGLPPEAKNLRKWTPLDEAIALCDKEAVKALLVQLRLDIKLERKARKPRLLAAMQASPDFCMQMRWELGSPLFGLLMRRYAPDDTYTMYKVGLRLRVDGSLRGLDPLSHSLLPRWKHSPFSLLLDASTTPVSAVLVDHVDGTWLDLYEERKKALKDPAVDAEDLIAAGAGRVKLKGSAISFEPERSWLGRPVTAKLEGHVAEAFEMAGRMMAVVTKKAAVTIPPDSTFEQYISMHMPADESKEVPWDPLRSPPPSVTKTFASEVSWDAEVAAELAVGIRGGSGYSSGGGEHRSGGKQGHEEGRRVSGRVWMARDFPMSLHQLLPLMEAMGSANKHILAASQWMAQYKDHSLFPLKVQVPLMWTVYVLLRFRAYRELRQDSGDPALGSAFFQVPPGCKAVQLVEETRAEEPSVEDTFYDAREE